MTYASILLHLDQGPHLAERTDYALALASRLGGTLTGLAASDRTLFEMGVATGLTVNADFAAALEATRLRAEARAREFADRAARAGRAEVDAVVDDADEVVALLDRSCCCDLVILGLPERSGDGHARAQRQLEDILLASVAPLLVLPQQRQLPDPRGPAIVGWNGSPEAARAVAAAMPLLEQASRVVLLRCHSAFDAKRIGGLPNLDLPAQWLERHGVPCEPVVRETSTDPGAVLLEAAEEAGAGLVVMGAWGRARWAEKLLGGATELALERATVPLLMCH